MIKAALFDLDNTLYDYDTCHKNAMSEVLNYVENTLFLSKKDFLENFEKARISVKCQLANTASEHNRLLYFQKTLEFCCLPIIPTSLQLYRLYWNIFMEKMVPFKEAVPLLSSLKEQGIKMGLLTDLTADIQLEKIEKLGFSEYFEALVTSEEVGAEKPNPIGFYTVLNKLSVHFDEAIMVGDSLTKDILGAENIGVKAILFNSPHESTCKISSLMEVMNYI